MDWSDRSSPAVEFGADLEPAVNSVATVELSTDGGQTWSEVWRRGAYEDLTPGSQAVPLTAAAGQSAVRVRFHYTGQWSGWWSVDDVFLGDRTCTPAT